MPLSQKLRLALFAITALAGHAHAKVWCDFGKKGGYYAEACPAGSQTQEVAAPPPTPERWEPRIGMTSSEVLQHVVGKQCFDNTPIQWCSFGEPKINRTETSSHVREQWVFGSGYAHAYLYFVDGVLTTISDQH